MEDELLEPVSSTRKIDKLGKKNIDAGGRVLEDATQATQVPTPKLPVPNPFNSFTPEPELDDVSINYEELGEKRSDKLGKEKIDSNRLVSWPTPTPMSHEAIKQIEQSQIEQSQIKQSQLYRPSTLFNTPSQAYRPATLVKTSALHSAPFKHVRRKYPLQGKIETLSNRGVLEDRTEVPKPKAVSESFSKARRNMEVKDSESKTKLHRAVMSGDYALTNRLLEQGADIEAKDQKSQTPLHLTVKKANFDNMNIFLETRARRLAIMQGNFEIIKTLLEKGANINAKDKESQTPLHLATTHKTSLRNGTSLINLLLDHEADIEAKDKDSQTPLHLAVKNENFEIVKTLLEKGANINAKDKESWTPLHLATTDKTSLRNGTSLINLLLDHKADIEAKDKDSQTPLHLATRNADLFVIKVLLNNGANIEAKDKDSKRALHWATANRNEAVTTLLLSRGADISVLDKSFWTDTLRAIRAQIFSVVSESSSSQLQRARFSVDWDLRRYLEKEIEGKPEFASLLTLTGTVESAYATTCEQYLDWCWPNSGRETLKLLQSAIGQQSHNSKWSSGAAFEYDASNWNTQVDSSYIDFAISGTLDHIIDVAQQLSWLTATFRCPHYGELTTSEVVLKYIYDKEVFKIYPKYLQRIDKKVEESCWHSLFKNTVIARDFPIPARQEERGVELPFEVMVALSNVSYPTEFYNGVILKGPFTALIPTAHLSNSIQWHFMCSEVNVGRLRTDTIAKHISNFFETGDIDLLRKARTFLGYCRNAEIHLGTEDANYKNIERSDADREPSTVRINRETSIALGSSGMGIFGGMLGLKITYSKGLQATTGSLDLSFKSKLLRSRDDSLLLYDTQTNRGWLVSELSVILHLAHIRALREPDSQFENRDKIPYAKVSGDGGLAAWIAITERNKLSNGSSEENLGLDVVKDLMTVLESRKEIIIKQGTSFSNPLKKLSLQGWEFVDVAALKFLCSRNEVPFNRNTGGNWYKITEGNPDLIVLFGKGFGEPIRPRKTQEICRSLTPMPQGKHYLIASMPCLQQLIKNHSNSPNFPKLTSNMYWSRPLTGNLFEDCTCDFASYCNRLQDIDKKKNSESFNSHSDEQNAAVVFGIMSQNSRSPCQPMYIDRNHADQPADLQTSSGAIRPTSSKHPIAEGHNHWRKRRKTTFARRGSVSKGLEEIDSTLDEDIVEGRSSILPPTHSSLEKIEHKHMTQHLDLNENLPKHILTACYRQQTPTHALKVSPTTNFVEPNSSFGAALGSNYNNSLNQTSASRVSPTLPGIHPLRRQPELRDLRAASDFREAMYLANDAHMHKQG